MTRRNRKSNKKSKSKLNWFIILGFIILIVLVELFYQSTGDLKKTLALLGFSICIFGVARLGSKIPFGKGSNSSGGW